MEKAKLIFGPYLHGDAWWIGAFMNEKCIAVVEDFGPFFNEAAALAAIPSHAVEILRTRQVRLRSLLKLSSHN